MDPQRVGARAVNMDARQIFDAVAATAAASVFDFMPAGPAAAGGEGPRDAGFRVRAPALPAVMAALRDQPALAFDFLQNLTAVDWPKRGAIDVVYHLFSYRHRHSICVRAEAPREAPVLPSVTALWPVANWLEREQFDLMGVIFDGHPDLRRLLMPDDWNGYPLRKDWTEPKTYRGMPTTRPSPLDLLVEYDRAHLTGNPRDAAGPAAIPIPAPIPVPAPDKDPVV